MAGREGAIDGDSVVERFGEGQLIRDYTDVENHYIKKGQLLDTTVKPGVHYN